MKTGMLLAAAVIVTLAGQAIAGETVLKGAEMLSTGRCDVRGDQYYSLWPPSDGWACYGMTSDRSNAEHPTVYWIAADGGRSQARLSRKGN